MFRKPALLYSFLAFLAMTFGSTAHAQEVAGEHKSDEPKTRVITNTQVNTAQLNVNQLRAIFSLRLRNWPNGLPIRVIVLDDKHPDTLPFVKDVLKMLPHQLRRQWDRIIYSGLGQGPLVVSDNQEMLAQVMRTPGAIGFTAGDAAHDNVQVLEIE